MDSPRNINKDFIHGALSDAIARIGEELDLSEAERNDIELDQDTQGVPGSPEISRVILEKIASARVVVTDVSLIASGNNQKPHINSNVAIELGYAYGKLGDEAVLKVMNTHYGLPSDLPFDLRSRRHPIQYELAPGADKDWIKKERKKLAGQLYSILRNYVKDWKSPSHSAHEEIQPIDMRGRYWESTEPLVPKDADRYESSDLYWYGQSILYFRCIPSAQLPSLKPRVARDLVIGLPPLCCNGGYSHSRNKWGAISYNKGSDDRLIGATQLFRNREIWGIDLTSSNMESQSDDDDEEQKRFIPTVAIQRHYPRVIENIRKLAKNLEYGDSYIIEMGLSGAKDVHLGIEWSYYGGFPGPFYDEEVYIRKTINENYHTMQIMNAFWDKLFSEIGKEVPDKLLWKADED